MNGSNSFVLSSIKVQILLIISNSEAVKSLLSNSAYKQATI